MAIREEQRDWLTLSMVPGVGSVHFVRLLARFRTAGAVLKASRGALAEVVGRALAERIAQYADTVDVEAQERAMAACGATLVTLADPDYPVRLAEIYDPPLALFVRGALCERDEHCVALVGTRRASPYGIRMAEKFGRELAARGVTVVSGMASGIDTAAHRGAIEAGGRTIAVLGCGVDVVYPRQNEGLMQEIAGHGAVLSQFAMGVGPSKGHFPYRNRIISGMTLGTLVVEAPISSGALITARHAIEQGREVFAIPGQIGTLGSGGPHALIRDGAKLVETVEDILVELSLPPEIHLRPATPPRGEQPEAPLLWDRPAADLPAAARKVEVELPPPARAPMAEPAHLPLSEGPQPSGVERQVLKSLKANGSFVDEIAAVCRISVSEALSSLTLLELKGLVRQFSGKRFAPR